ncbi:MAG: glycosyltransferase, partial [Bacteroidota bacterium]
MKANNKPHILLISYYWPPSGGAGVQRWLKFTKYLSDQYRVTVYTPSNPTFPSIDEAMSAEVPSNVEVLKTPIWEPYRAYGKLMGKGKGESTNSGFSSEKGKVGFLELLSRWIRGNWFIPDARKYWIKPSIKFLNNWYRENEPDLIISTGPPHSMHIIAMALKKEHKTPWIADFRDPWTNIDFYQELKLSAKSDRKHHELEKAVCTTADELFVVGNTMKKEFEEAYPGIKVSTVYNGFDPADVKQDPGSAPLEKFSIAHIGSMGPARNVPLLWDVLAELCEEDPQFKEHLQIDLVGAVDGSIKQSIDEKGLTPQLRLTSYLPHSEAVAFQKKSALLLLVVNQSPNAKGILTGKVFEYLASER